ncbi:MAG TPA: SAM-dependent methyltransferase [Planctomycetota bacterium]|nr:SAM-dependent methyltransferase [Planctomycetota bacterium]
MADRLSQEDFARTLASALERADEVLGLVCRSKETPVRKEIFRIWGDKVTRSSFLEKKQTGQETFLLSELPGRAAELAAPPFAMWELQSKTGDLHARRAKRAILVTRGKASGREAATAHDRPRDRLLDPHDPATRKLLHAIGLASAKGHVLPGREKKLRQVEHFVRLALSALEEVEGELEILDAGCGAAYLTFALHHVLSRVRKGRVSVLGVDVREDVIEASEKVARELGVAGEVRFVRGRIGEAKLGLPRVVLSLHACDTATDEALARGVALGASVILAAPCCQHELHDKLRTDDLSPILRHGILRERLADLATDALRASILRANGYRTDVVEFVDPEATAKNVLIRAVSVRGPLEPRWKAEIAETKRALGLNEPVALERFLAGK